MACGGPTGSEDNPELLVTPLVLDYGETNTSQFLTVTNSGTGVLRSFPRDLLNSRKVSVTSQQMAWQPWS